MGKEPAGQSIRQSEERYRLLVERAPDAILVFDLDMDRWVDANPNAERLFGCTRDQLLNLGPLNFFPTEQPDGRPLAETIREHQERALAGEEVVFERLIRNAEGREIICEVRLVRLPEKKRRLLRASYVDITARKRAELEIMRSHEMIQKSLAEKLRKLSRAVEQSPVMVVITDIEGKVEYVNPKFTEITGYSFDEVMGKNPRILKSGKVSPEAYKDLWATLTAGHVWHGEFLNRKKNGELYWELASISPITDEHGRTTHYVAVKEDITGRRQTEENLRHANRALLAITECNEALVKATTESELLNAICRTIAQTGVNRLAWVGFALDDAAKSVQPVAMEGVDVEYLKTARITWSDGPRGQGPVGMAIRTGKVAVCRDTQTDPCFEPWKEAALRSGYLSVISLPLNWERKCLGAMSIYASETDAFTAEEVELLKRFASNLTFGIVTLRTRAERERLQKELIEIAEDERRRIGNDLHDGVCQQLCAIQLFSGLMADSLPPESKALENFDQLEKHIEQAVIETRLLARGLSPVAVDAAGLMGGLLELTENTKKLCVVACEFQCPELVLVSDKAVATHLYRIAQEAIQNAIKHGRAKQIVVALKKTGAELLLEIVDDGTGISKDSTEKGGMGFRTMTYRADLIGGNLEISPAAGCGTRVACTCRMD